MIGWLRRRMLRRVVVQTTNDSSIEGVLWKIGRDGIVLYSARLLSESGPVALDGDTFIPKAKVHFVQVLSRPEPASA